MAKIFSVKVAKRLFKEESADLVLCHENMILAASAEFAEEGDYVASGDILARYADLKFEVQCMLDALQDEI